MKYQVIVFGVVLYESDDQLCADEIARNYRVIGWKKACVKVINA